MVRPPKRNVQTDVLRAIAIVLVLVCHLPGSPLRVQGGWIGVDLFFTLSGFLISTLLFQEYLRYGSLDIKRFYIRRGFKIFPSFWLMLLVTAATMFRSNAASREKLLWEILLIQNYQQAVWWHTWSIAVEVHFYILLPLLLLVLARCGREQNDPFAAIPRITLGLAITTLILRCLVTAYVHPFNYWVHVFPTHLRADSIMFGVLLSYYAQFRRKALEEWMGQHRWWVLGASASVLALFLGQAPESPWVHTVGFTLLSLASGGVLLSVLFGGFSLPKAVRVVSVRVTPALAFVGFHSYSIYVWHLIVAKSVARFSALLHWSVDSPRYLLLALAYVPVSSVPGAVLARTVELPALKIRDRLFPRRAKPEASAIAIA